MNSINLKRIQSSISSGRFGAPAVLVTSPENRLFASGFASSAGMHLITEDSSVFITDFRYIEAARAGIENTEIIMIQRGQRYSDLINDAAKRLGADKVAFEDVTMTAAEAETYKKNFTFEMVPAGNAFSNLRAVKNEYELSLMRRAQEITDAAFADVLGAIHAGMTEREVRAELIYRLYRHGGDALSFDPVVVGGPNSSLPHGHATDRPIENGEFLTMDFGVLYGGYCSDMTRTVCIGKPTDEMRRIYDIVLEAQLLGLEVAKANLHWGRECDGVVRQFITEKGYGPNFGHGLGHGLGIEVHESLDFDPEKPGIAPVNGVVSVEPGIYLEGKFGVRIEDCVILKDGGNENLTKSPKELICI